MAWSEYCGGRQINITAILVSLAMKHHEGSKLKKDLSIKTAIVRTLKENGPSGYNMLYEKTHFLSNCGRNQFNRYLNELKEESVISHTRSHLHRQGTILQLGEKGSKYLEAEYFYFFAQALVNYLVPLSDRRETGSIEEQLAKYDLEKLLPFTIETELKSDTLDGRKIHAPPNSIEKVHSLTAG